jgi:hypothetical protein
MLYWLGVYGSCYVAFSVPLCGGMILWLAMAAKMSTPSRNLSKNVQPAVDRDGRLPLDCSRIYDRSRH